jgi:DNA-binding NarL/FixJ family response regulator
MHVRRVVLIDDDEDVAALIEAMLDDDPRFRVVGVAGDGHEGVALANRLQPDAVVLDLELPGMDGLAALPRLRQCAPAAKIVVFSAFPDPYTLLDVLELGADAYVDKATAWAELVPALEQACGMAPGGARSGSLAGVRLDGQGR